MIGIEALRSALFSDQPYTKLDALVRAELTAGRLTKQIRAELIALEAPLQSALNENEDAENALRDTIDALDGFAPRKYVYTNPPVLPTEEEIAELPRWARVAFAARCARRVLPIVKVNSAGAQAKFLEHRERLVSQTEHAAASGMPIKNDTWYVGASDSFWGSDPIEKAAFELRSVLMHAVLEATDNGPPSRVTALVTNLVAGSKAIGDLTPFIRRDFDHLAHLAKWQQWTDDTPVPPEVFGPLWPEGPPQGWPEDPEMPKRSELALDLFPSDQADSETIENEVVHLFDAMNRFHIARCGMRLTLDQFRSLLPSLVPAEA